MLLPVPISDEDKLPTDVVALWREGDGAVTVMLVEAVVVIVVVEVLSLSLTDVSIGRFASVVVWPYPWDDDDKPIGLLVATVLTAEDGVMNEDAEMNPEEGM